MGRFRLIFGFVLALSIASLPTWVIGQDAQDTGQAETELSEQERILFAAKLGYQSEIALLEGLLQALENHLVGLPADIHRSRSAITVMKKGLLGAQVPHKEKAPWWYPFDEWIVYDYDLDVIRMLEKWIVPYERTLRRPKLEYTMWELWQWLIPHEEAYLKDLEEELAALPDLIEQTRDQLSQKREEFKNMFIETTRHDPPTVDGDTDAHTLFDYCNIVADGTFRQVCYSQWGVYCSSITDPQNRSRCNDVLQPGGPRLAEGRIWDFCGAAPENNVEARHWCYDGFREMVASICGTILSPADRDECVGRAADLPSNLPAGDGPAPAK